MIAWLSDWLKEIVLIVLLAVFVDLLLPNRSMQRYVKVVLSLLILLAILSPLVELFHSQEQWDVWLEAAADLESGQTIPSEELPALRTIAKEADRISTERNRLALELAQQRLETAVVHALEEKLAIHKADVSTALRLGESSADVLLEHMTVHLWLPGEAEQAAAVEVPLNSGKPAVIQPIEPVASVSVPLRQERPESDSGPPSDADAKRKASDDAPDTPVIDDPLWRQAVTTILEEQFGIPPDKVRISVEARR